MSMEITTHFKKSYGDAVGLVAQQMASKLRGSVTEEGADGEEHYFDPIGKVEAEDVTERHGDSPVMSVPYLRRRAVLTPADVGDLVDDFDKMRTANDPTGKIPQAFGAAMARKLDDRIIKAFGATAYGGKEGTTAYPLGAAQQIADGSAGLTFDKVLEAKQKMDAADVDEGDRYFVIGPNQMNLDLLKIAEATSTDYALRALVDGRVDTWLGFKWIMSSRLPSASNVRSCYAYHRSGIGLAIGKEPTSEMERRSDKRFSMYFYHCDMMGAVRIEEEKVVEVFCQEP